MKKYMMHVLLAISSLKMFWTYSIYEVRSLINFILLHIMRLLLAKPDVFDNAKVFVIYNDNTAGFNAHVAAEEQALHITTKNGIMTNVVVIAQFGTQIDFL